MLLLRIAASQVSHINATRAPLLYIAIFFCQLVVANYAVLQAALM